METFERGERVKCEPSGIEGQVYAVAESVIYIKLSKGEIISSPPSMLAHLDPMCAKCKRRHAVAAGCKLSADKSPRARW